MKFLLLLLAVFLSACGSTMKVYDHGSIELNRVEKGRPMAPVLLVYQTYFRQHLHQIFFWDEDKNRFNLEIAPNTDTSKGILVYLPADRSYALSGMLFQRDTYWHDVQFGTELPMFFAKAGRVTQLTYFEVEQVGARSEYLFKVKKTSPDTQDLYLRSVRANFQNLDNMKAVQAL